MRRSRALFINLITLTGSSMVLQAIGFVFQVFLVGRIGAAGIGVFQLVSSVYMLASTVATSGVRFATTRLTAEELGTGNRYGARKAIRRCIAYALVFSLTTAVFLFAGAPWVAKTWIGNPQTVLSLRIFALTLPFMAFSSVMGGFFTSIQQMTPSAVVQVAGQLIRIGVTAWALVMPATQGLERSCGAIVLGILAGDIFSAAALLFLYLGHCRKTPAPKAKTNRLTQRLFGIALPIAVSAYARTALSTLQQMLTPRGLRLSGASADNAMATYGTIQGMVFPILFFPAGSVMVLSQLIVPELTESQVSGRMKRVNYIVNRVFRLGLLFCIGVAGVLFFYANDLGKVIYGNALAGYYLQIFAPMVVVSYLDSLVDGMLKGLGRQLDSMGYNILDALSGALLIYFLLPPFAIGGYVFAVFFTEILNFALSLGKLLSITQLKPRLGMQLRAVLCIIASRCAALLFIPPGRWALSPVTLAARIILTILFYLIGLYLTACLTGEDWRWFGTLVKGE